MAHSPSAEQLHWQTLRNHALGVADRTEQHVRYLQPSIPQVAAYARAAGLLHDLGKYRDDFQIHRLQWHPHEERHDPSFEKRPCPHSDAGAQLLATEFEMDGAVRSELPFVIAGHHTHLTDTSTLKDRLRKTKPEETHELFARALEDTPELRDLLQDFPDLPLEGTERAFLIRLLFSALVDADRLDTEEHGSPSRAELRSIYGQQAAEMGLLFERLQTYMAAKKGSDTVDEPINVLRREMYEAALSHANDPTGFFRLTVPTGGGKTLTSLAFALRHAQAHGLRRVVYGVPFTTIIDQTAQVFRDVLEQGGRDFKVLEHHSNLEPRSLQSMGAEERQTLAELSTENWDAPVIVTTTVRLFQETLFGTGTGALRRLHNLTGSVIVLDEAQSLPANLLTPTLDALQFLVKYCSCSVVLCTATQPALEESLGFPSLGNIRELVDGTEQFFSKMQRVHYQFRLNEPVGWAALAADLKHLPQVLCIVNTRQQARELFIALGDTGENFHLSTNMCPVHRRKALTTIRQRLKTGQPCRVISTQLIEAGIDVDFPAVYRALGPLEAIVQAAGRCNREGKLKWGQVTVFIPEQHKMPHGDYEVRERLARAELAEGRDLNKPDAFTEYFRCVYNNIPRAPEVRVADGKQPFQKAHAELRFEQVADAYRMIQDCTVPVIVRSYGGERVDELLRTIQYSRSREERRAAWRALQGYTVNLYAYQVGALLAPDGTRPPLLQPVPELEERARRLGVEPLAIYQWPETVRYNPKLGIVPQVEADLMTIL